MRSCGVPAGMCAMRSSPAKPGSTRGVQGTVRARGEAWGAVGERVGRQDGKVWGMLGLSGGI